MRIKFFIFFFLWSLTSFGAANLSGTDLNGKWASKSREMLPLNIIITRSFEVNYPHYILTLSFYSDSKNPISYLTRTVEGEIVSLTPNLSNTSVNELKLSVSKITELIREKNKITDMLCGKLNIPFDVFKEPCEKKNTWHPKSLFFYTFKQNSNTLLLSHYKGLKGVVTEKALAPLYLTIHPLIK